MTANTDTFTAAVAATMRAELSRRGLHRTAIADVIGVSRPTAYNRLNGVTPFTAEEIDKIAAFLDIDVYELIQSSAPKPRHEAGVELTAARDSWAQPARARKRSA